MRSFKVLLIGLLATALAVATTLTVTAMSTEGSLAEQANRVYVAKDVTADILPPPMYLIEMRLVASQALEGSMELATAKSEIARLKSEYLARVQYWTASPPYGLEAQLLGEQHAAANVFIDAIEQKFLPAISAGDMTDAKQALMAAHVLYLRHRRGVDATVAASTTFATDEMTAFNGKHARSQTLNIAALGIGAVILLAFFMLVRRGVNRTIGGEPETLAASAAALAAGDLTHRLESEHPGSVAASLESTRLRLAQIIQDTRRSSQEVLDASREIELGTQDLGQRTEQQAGSLEETASAMEELNSTVKENAEAARKASDLATGAASVAEQGGSDVQRVVATMQEIQQNSQRIAEIIAVIDEIAFQTNLLALNAAVEAARAGEQGRGFAVVAGEVGALAKRSAQAAREIKDLIQTSVENVSSGSQQVNSAGKTMAEIVARVREVSELIQDIARATQDQSAGIGNVNDSMMEVDKMTQQNAALVEQSTAAAMGLRSQAAKLVDGVAQFQLGEEERANPRGRESARAPQASGRVPSSSTERSEAARAAA